MNLRMLRYSSQKPSANYYKIAKQGLADYFKSKPQAQTVLIKPGAIVPIDELLENRIVKYNELVHGFYEFVIDQPGEISVVQTDPWVNGIDGSTGSIMSLSGNYGIMYDIEVNWKSKDGKGLALITWNARAGAKWCDGMVNVIRVSKGKFGEEYVQVPSDKLFNSGYPDAVLLQVFLPDPDKEIQKIRLTFTPPGATCLPVPLGFIPVDLD